MKAIQSLLTISVSDLSRPGTLKEGKRRCKYTHFLVFKRNKKAVLLTVVNVRSLSERDGIVRTFLKIAMAGLLAVGAAGSAQAAETFLFDFSGNSSVNGTYGNARTFSATAGGETLNLRATGWSINGSTINSSYLGIWNAGLGVTSAGDSSGSNNLHTVDNKGRVDFIVLEFDKAVQLTSAVFNAYQVSGYSYKDADATIRYGTNPNDWNSDPFTNGASISALNALAPNSYNSDVSSTSQYHQERCER